MVKKKTNPLLQQKEKEGYDLGYKHAKMMASAFFGAKIKRLESLPGFGPKRIKQIQDAVGSPLNEEEMQEVERAFQMLVAGEGKKKGERIKWER